LVAALAGREAGALAAIVLGTESAAPVNAVVGGDTGDSDGCTSEEEQAKSTNKRQTRIGNLIDDYCH
jgi:hypothetical protein